MLHSTMLSDSIGIRLIRSTSSPTGIVNTGPDEQRDRAQQPDLGVADVQRVLELRRDRADRRRVGAVQRQHPREQERSRAPAPGRRRRLTTSP